MAPETSPGPCVVREGPNQGRPCVFPFLWRHTGVTYTGCAFDKSRDIAPWCSTKVSLIVTTSRRFVESSTDHLLVLQTVGGVHQSGQGEWGYCSPSCPLSAGLTTQPPATPPPTVAPGIAAGCGN